VSEHGLEALRAGGFVVAAAIALGLQRLSPHGRLKESWRTNLGVWFVNLLVMSAVCGACAFTVANWARVAGVGFLTILSVPLWLSVMVSVFVLDVVSYGWHRANHQVPVLWRFHQVHHSDTGFTVSTGIRFHPGELVLSLPIRLAAIVALGAPVEGVIIFEVLFTVANLVEHGDIDLPGSLEQPLAQLFITPALHRWHHSRQWVDLNTNFGTIFAFWDRLFSTYHENTSMTEVETGLPGCAEPPSFTSAMILPLTQGPIGPGGRLR
jgi:sterol desaturase/sphingolipid hydroxylase (fatty acid hydroxylase superfamily)